MTASAGPYDQPADTPDTPDAPQAPPLGPLLDLPLEEAATLAKELADSTQALVDHFAPDWLLARLMRKGVRGARKRSDTERTATNRTDERAALYVPPGALNATAVPNTLHTAINNMVAVITVDPGAVDADPASESDEDRQAAELASRVLERDTGDNGADGWVHQHKALNRAATYRSVFSYQYVEPRGRQVPREVRAHVNAIDPNNPLLDPLSGMPPASDDQVVTKYVRQGQLVTEAVDVEQRWAPKVCKTLLWPWMVRPLPTTATEVEEWEGVVICWPTTWSVVSATFPSILELDEKAQRAIADWRPSDAYRWSPAWITNARTTATAATYTKDGKPDPHTPVYLRLIYYRSCGAYPWGAYVVEAGGGTTIVHRQKWAAVMGPPDERREQALELPIAQLKWKDDPTEDTPFGMSAVDEISGMTEGQAALFAMAIQHLYKLANPHTYVPLGTDIQPDQYAARGRGPLPFDPQAGGLPIFEQLPPVAADVWGAIDRLDGKIDALTIDPAAQGQVQNTVRSGEHFHSVVEQALTRLSEPKQRTGQFLMREGRIGLQLRAAFYDVPTLVSYTTPDGAYVSRAFQGADLGTTKDVVLRRGTLTMQAPSAKQQMALQEYQIAAQAGDPTAWETYKRTMGAAIASRLGVEDDPARRYAERAVATWDKGPPDGMDDAAMAQQAGALFLQSPAAQETDVARSCWLAMRRTLLGVSFWRHPEAWRAGFLQAYEAIRQAGGITTTAEAQQAQAGEGQQAVAVEQTRQQGAQALEAQKHEQKLAEIDADVQGDIRRQEATETLIAQRQAMTPLAAGV
jgi:hypothetical protein